MSDSTRGPLEEREGMEDGDLQRDLTKTKIQREECERLKQGCLEYFREEDPEMCLRRIRQDDTPKKQMGRKYPKKWVIITATQTTQEMGHYYLIYGRVEVTLKTNG